MIQNIIVLSFQIINQQGVHCLFTHVWILKGRGHVTTDGQFDNCDPLVNFIYHNKVKSVRGSTNVNRPIGIVDGGEEIARWFGKSV